MIALGVGATSQPAAAFASPSLGGPDTGAVQPDAGSAPDEPAPPQAPTTVEEALAAGDLATARDLARAAREADPSVENWRREGEILERMGAFAEAESAYAGALEVLPQDATAAREALRGDIARVRESARGRVETEPTSKHRSELDTRWAPPKPTRKAAAAPSAEPEPVDARSGRIVTKWYFWVTVAAIVASAAAVTGIAIKSARDEKGDALDFGLAPPRPQGPAVFRF